MPIRRHFLIGVRFIRCALRGAMGSDRRAGMAMLLTVGRAFSGRVANDNIVFAEAFDFKHIFSIRPLWTHMPCLPPVRIDFIRPGQAHQDG
jgi:hypothetical protein